MDAALEHIRKVEARKALSLRASGRTYEEIAGELCYQSAGQARAAVAEALQDHVEEDPETARQLELFRLDRLLEEIEQASAKAIRAAGTDSDGASTVLGTVTRTIKLRLSILDRRASLLGLNQSPTPPNTGDGQTVIERVVIAVGGQQQANAFQVQPQATASAQLVEATPPLRIPAHTNVQEAEYTFGAPTTKVKPPFESPQAPKGSEAEGER